MIVDAHLHFWNLTKAEYPWLSSGFGPIYANFEAPDVEPQLIANKVDKAVMVQAANSYEDTAYMLEVADRRAWAGGVVGWVNLLDPDEAHKRLSMYSRNRHFKGVRHLIHDEPDPDWVVQDRAIEGLKVVASFGLPFDVVAIYPKHIVHIPTLVEKIPNLRMVIDHLAKPPYPDPAAMAGWRAAMRVAAQSPNVYVKVSGLNTAAGKPDWSYQDIKPGIDFAREVFGAQRMMFGGDWPVAILAGNYTQVVTETARAIADYSAEEQAQIWSKTAIEFYKLTV
jgi:L-fuconolactonase